MTYTKPSVVTVGRVVTMVQSMMKGVMRPLDILAFPTVGAYDADE